MEDVLLEQLMQQHVHNIADFLLVVSEQVCTAACPCRAKTGLCLSLPQGAHAARSHHIMYMASWGRLSQGAEPGWEVVRL